ncbi:MAG: hypothetical protein JJ934_01735 [Pseudomonadales bacterium]|nr:hypothetical protein [Pseudomonadales bacterium]
MSGIAGIVDFSGEQDATSSVRKMLDAMSYRGPDGRALQSVLRASFGFLKLDSSGLVGDQPLRDAGTLLVADVHLTERETLCAGLSCDLAVTDSVLLLKAYRKWGKNCVGHLKGAFAFAICDADGLFMARDHLGVKPLYYSELPDRRVIFASEAKAVAREAKTPLSATRIADALAFPLEHVDKVCTPWRGVYRVPPGSLLTANRQGLSLEQYWDGSKVSLAEMEDAEWNASFRETLLTVLREHQRGDETLAITLSGGVDSSTLVCVAASAGLPVQTFSTVQDDDPGCLETRHIRFVTENYELQACKLNPEDIDDDADLLMDLQSSLQEPFDAHMIQMLILNLAAKRAGHAALLDGVDGEMIYSMPSSYPSFLLRAGRVTEGLREAWQGAIVQGDNPLTGIYRCLRGLGAPRLLRTLKGLAQRDRGLRDAIQDAWISRHFAEEQEIVERLSEMRNRLYGRHDSMSEMHRRSVTHPAICAALERYDRIAALSGIESRHPLLDLRLVELMLSAPDHLKVRHGWSKYLLRLAGAPDVPSEVSWRRDKDENGWRFAARLIELRGEYIQDYLANHRSGLEACVRSDALQATDETLLEIYGICHWMLTQLEEFDLA